MMFSLFTFGCFSQTGRIIKDDSVIVCILKLDYLTYQFEGGNISYYSRCSETDTLPFKVDVKLPGDVGRVLFKLNETGDTIFMGSYIWAGRGKIKYPVQYSTDTPFHFGKIQTLKGKHIEYFDWYGFKNAENPELIKKADSALTVISFNNIVSMFAQYNFKIGVYRYHTQDGILDESKAKWIVFLFSLGQANAVLKPNRTECLISPNPASKELNVNIAGEYSFSIYDINCRKMLQGEVCNSKIDIVDLNEGLYFLELKNDTVISRFKLIKINAQ